VRGEVQEARPRRQGDERRGRALPGHERDGLRAARFAPQGTDARDLLPGARQIGEGPSCRAQDRVRCAARRRERRRARAPRIRIGARGVVQAAEQDRLPAGGPALREEQLAQARAQAPFDVLADQAIGLGQRVERHEVQRTVEGQREARRAAQRGPQRVEHERAQRFPARALVAPGPGRGARRATARRASARHVRAMAASIGASGPSSTRVNMPSAPTTKASILGPAVPENRM
jgi:hypothetical protein